MATTIGGAYIDWNGYTGLEPWYPDGGTWATALLYHGKWAEYWNTCGPYGPGGDPLIVLSDPTTFNILISQEKTNSAEATLLSKLDESNQNGYCIGIDSANNLYCKYYEAQQPQVFTYINPINNAKNIYRVSLERGYLSCSRFNREAGSIPIMATWIIFYSIVAY